MQKSERIGFCFTSSFGFLTSDFIHLPSRISRSNTYLRSRTAQSRSQLAALFSIPTPGRFSNSRRRRLRRKHPPANPLCETGGGPWRKRLGWQLQDSNRQAGNGKFSEPARGP